MNRYITLLPLAVLACSTEEQSSSAKLPSYTITVGYPEMGDARHYHEWIGQFASIQKVPIIPQISGYISERLFRDGQEVKEGDILYQISPKLYQQALNEAEQDVVQKKAALAKAQQNLDYYTPLLQKEAISRQTYTDAKQLVDEAEADLQAASAAEKQARIELGYCTLRAPISGYVGFAQSYAGAYVSPASQPLVELSLLDPIRINFAISEQEWLSQNSANDSLREGVQVKIVLADGQNYPLQATIKGIDTRVNTATGTLMLEAQVGNPQGLLRPGMYALVAALVEQQKDALWVPSSAIASMQGMDFVLVYPEDGKVSMVPVKLGLRKDDRVVIRGEGVTEKTRIITNGTQQGMMAAAGRCMLNISPDQPAVYSAKP